MIASVAQSVEKDGEFAAGLRVGSYTAISTKPNPTPAIVPAERGLVIARTQSNGIRKLDPNTV